MSLRGKKLVEEFYRLFSNEPKEATALLHPEVTLDWYNSTGYRKLNKTNLTDLIKEMNVSYESLRLETYKTIKEDQNVVIYFSYYVKTIENPEEELPFGHFMVIWELKENLLYKGSQISQLPH